MLSPALDINPEHRPEGWLQTPISDIHGAECSIRSAIDAALFFDLSEGKAREMIRTMARTIATEWRPMGRKLGMSSGGFCALGPVMENDDLAWAQAL